MTTVYVFSFDCVSLLFFVFVYLIGVAFRLWFDLFRYVFVFVLLCVVDAACFCYCFKKSSMYFCLFVLMFFVLLFY